MDPMDQETDADREPAREPRAPPRSHSRDAAAEEPVRRRGMIARGLLDDRALFVVKRLQRSGHEAYLVGGCVRDLIAGLEPKDFDVATDARPNRIKRLFRSARVIGRRFRLVHIRFPGDHVIETSTFRGDPQQIAEDRGDDDAPDAARARSRDWRDRAENVFGTAPEDARRRDFTVNALFFDPVRAEVIDYVGGLSDLDAGLIRSIGEPAARLHEDPVRMLRAVHFAQRMDFRIEPRLEKAIVDQAGLLRDASQARLYVELVKMLTRGRARGTFRRLHQLGVLGVWLPELTAALDEPIDWPARPRGTHEEARRGEPADTPIVHATWNLLGAADRWGLAAHRAPESIAMAVLFGPWLLRTFRLSGRRGLAAFNDHLEATFRPVALRMSVPRWVQAQMRDILWMLDDMRHPPSSRRRARMVRRPAFPAAAAFLELDLRARACSLDTFDLWHELAQEAGVELRFDRIGRARATRKRKPDRPRRGRGRGRGRRHRRRGHRPPSEPEAGAWAPPPPD
jgi:poly(A) polymerase